MPPAPQMSTALRLGQGAPNAGSRYPASFISRGSAAEKGFIHGGATQEDGKTDLKSTSPEARASRHSRGKAEVWGGGER